MMCLATPRAFTPVSQATCRGSSNPPTFGDDPFAMLPTLPWMVMGTPRHRGDALALGAAHLTTAGGRAVGGVNLFSIGRPRLRRNSRSSRGHSRVSPIVELAGRPATRDNLEPEP